MYSICSFVYGIVLDREHYELLNCEPEYWIEQLEGDPIEIPYDGSGGPSYGYIGVGLGSIEPSSGDWVEGTKFCGINWKKDVWSFDLIPTEEQKKQFQEKMDSLPDEVKKIVSDLKPRVYLYWSTS